jgi:sulfonate transport system ATP-binding protein
MTNNAINLAAHALAPAATGSTLAVRNLSISYPVADGAHLAVLQGIDLDFVEGGVTAILGASGCGKSTLLRILAGLETRYSGAVTLADATISQPGLDRGLVFQDHRLVPWMTVEQNIALSLHRLPPAQQRERIANKLALVGLQAFAQAYPSRLSGGMAQRVAIARALAHEPRVLLLDEPFAALDAMTRLQLQDELLNICQRTRITAVLVTHDIEEALYLGDRIAVLSSRPGRLLTTFDVALPRPRDRANPEFAALRLSIYQRFFRGAH